MAKIEDFIRIWIDTQIKEKGLNRSTFGRKIGRSREWVHNKLEGRRPIFVDDLFLIAKALGMNARDLIPYKDDWMKRMKKMLGPKAFITTRIKNELKRKGMEQQELANKVGMSPQSFNHKISGRNRMSIEELFRIAEGLEIDVRDLFPTKDNL